MKNGPPTAPDAHSAEGFYYAAVKPPGRPTAPRGSWTRSNPRSASGSQAETPASRRQKPTRHTHNPSGGRPTAPHRTPSSPADRHPIQQTDSAPELDTSPGSRRSPPTPAKLDRMRHDAGRSSSTSTDSASPYNSPRAKTI